MLNRVMRVLIAVLALAGMYVSVQALKVHNMDPGLAPPCAVSEKWDCGIVNHSRYAVFPAKTFDEAPGTRHVPIATVGIAGYALMAVVALLGWWRFELLLAVGGFGVAAYLTYIEKFVIQKWCIYCLWSQSIVAVILLATIVALTMRRETPASRTVR